MKPAHKRSSKGKIVIPLVVFIIISLLIYFYRESGPAYFVQGIFQSVFAVPRSILYSLGRGDASHDQILELLKKNEDLTQKMVNFELIQKDNEALKSQFASSGDTSPTLVTAKIVGFLGDRKTPSSFVVNAGSSQGIQKGMAVIYEKYLIGKVVNASNKYSVILTPLNNSFQVLAKLSDTNANGLLLGNNDFMTLDRVVITDTLNKDSIVLTKGEVDNNGIGILPDLIIGKIVSVSKKETAPFQSAEVIPLVDYSRLTQVFIIKSM